MPGTIKRKLFVGFFVAFTVVIAMLLISYQSTTQLVETNSAVSHSHEVISNIENVNTLLTQEELTARNFMLTQDSSYAYQLTGQTNTFNNQLAFLRKLTSDNPNQSERIQRLGSLSEVRNRGLNIVLRIDSNDRIGRRKALQTLVLNYDHDIQLTLGEMRNEEHRLLTMRLQDSEHSRNVTYWWLAVLALVDLLLLGFLYSSNLLHMKRQTAITDTLRESRAAVSALIENTDGAIWSVDREFRVTAMNEAYRRLHQMATGKDITIGDSVNDPNANADQLRGMEYYRRALDGKRSTVEWQRQMNRGTIVYELMFFPIKTDGEVVGVAVHARNISDRKQIEETLREARDTAIEASKMKSDFLANMSHEIRTPMNGIVGMTGLLLDSELTSEQQSYADAIRDSADALLTIINDILDFSKIEAGKLTFETLDFNLQNAVEGVMDLLSENAAKKQLELLYSVDDNVPLDLRGDPGRLRQVLVNLLGNGIKFTPKGEVILRVTTEDESDTQAMLRFEVQDTGIGMKKETVDHLFGAFYQGDASTTRQYGGTGLGLAISKRLIEMMNGSIGVESVPNKGSKFWFTAVFGKKAGSARNTSQPIEKLRGMRTLVVDDNATNRTILEHQLLKLGLQPVLASSGKDALSYLERSATDLRLAILDFNMPEMDGITLANTLRQKYPEAAIILLASNVPSSAHQSQSITRTLTKPVKQQQLCDAIEEAVLEHAVPQPKQPTAVVHRQPAIPVSTVYKILLAEDNIVNQKVAQQQLRSLGYSTDVVANGEEALRAYQSVPYDLVLMDCQMPVMDGFDATGHIRAYEHSNEGKKHIPIIAMTANAMAGDRERCLAAGMDDYISKPVKKTDLEALLRRWLPADGAGMDGASMDGEALPPVSEVLNEALTREIMESVDNDPKQFQEFVDLFLESTNQRLETLGEGLRAHDPKQVASAAHAVRGSAATMGAEQLSKIFHELEQAALAGDWSRAESLLTDAKKKLRIAERTLKAYK